MAPILRENFFSGGFLGGGDLREIRARILHFGISSGPSFHTTRFLVVDIRTSVFPQRSASAVCFFFTLVTGPRRSLRLKLSETAVK